jgi:hypothetical protein
MSSNKELYMFVTMDENGQPDKFLGKAGGKNKEKALEKLKEKRGQEIVERITRSRGDIYAIETNRGAWGKPLVHRMESLKAMR